MTQVLPVVYQGILSRYPLTADASTCKPDSTCTTWPIRAGETRPKESTTGLECFDEVRQRLASGQEGQQIGKNWDSVRRWTFPGGRLLAQEAHASLALDLFYPLWAKRVHLGVDDVGEALFPTPILVAEIPSTTARPSNGDKFQTPSSQQEAMSRFALSLASPRHWCWF
jgi:hypothetical protein